jgi:hypothetical protein
MSWYSKVARDMGLLHDATEYFQSELLIAKTECKLKGSLERESSELPGIVENRYSQLQEVEAILELLNIELTKLKSQCFRKYLESYARVLSSRECDKFVEGENDVVEFMKIINEFALLRNQWLAITKGLDIKQWQLTNLTKLKCAGLDDASV